MALQAGSKGVNPKDLTPLSNRVKEVGDMDAYLTKEEARRTYLTLVQSEDFLTKLVAQATYQTIANMANYQEKLVDGQNIKRINGEGLLGSGNINVLTQAIADGIYQTISGMSDYVKWSDLPDVPSLQNYVQKTEAPGYADILTKTLASSIYQTVSGMVNYVTKNEAPGYDDILTETLASTTYQTISGMSDYLTKLDAQTLYQTISGMSAYLTKLEAQTLYQAILQSGVNIKTINNQSLLGSGNINIQSGGLTIDLLWTNSSPSSSFAAQTIQLDLSSYKAVIITVKPNTNLSEMTNHLLLIDGETKQLQCAYFNGTLRSRNATVTTSGITFGDGIFWNTYNNSNSAQSQSVQGIPVKIYGVK